MPTPNKSQTLISLPETAWAISQTVLESPGHVVSKENFLGNLVPFEGETKLPFFLRLYFWHLLSKMIRSDDALTLETSALKLFAVSDLHYQLIRSVDKNKLSCFHFTLPRGITSSPTTELHKYLQVILV